MGKRTVFFKNKPVITGVSTIAGPKESMGPIGKYIETRLENDKFDEKTFEKAECKMLSFAIDGAIKNANKKREEIDAILAGDLLNQIISSSYAARDFEIPYIGVYNACSTMSESMALGSVLIDGGYMENVICATGSHFATAERQYRYPLELGSVRPPQAQWTVTGAGAVTLSKKGKGPIITMATFGKVVDFGITDANNMGAAMAPAAVDTLITHFNENNFSPDDYDLIITGDLGSFGSKLFKDLVWEKGFDISTKHVDCGAIIYEAHEKEFQGGSGAGCSAVVLNSYFYNKLKNKEINKIFFLATGALLSTVSTQQGESIPCISHGVVIENRG
ncbi:MAG: stage V sporulation protein AD [Clostridiales bacterium]|nr:stage V sporulation protein AD [Clostridiales bacterium]